MSFLLTRRPEKRFGVSTKLSRWTALSNPYLFEFTRADFSITNTRIRTAYNATKPTVEVTYDPASLGLFIYAGDEIYLNSGMYNGIYTVYSITDNYVTLDTPFIGNGGQGRINLSQRFINYKAYINIYDGVTGDLIDSVYPKPDSTGFLIYDVSGVIRSIANTRLTTIQSSINKANKGISGGFNIGYGATYTAVFPLTSGNVTLPEILVDNIYYWAVAARQIDGDVSLGMNGIGQNLKEYVPKNLLNSNAKFLTMFERPTYFEGFPFFLSFIYDEDFSDVYLERHQQDVDINGVDVGSETDNTLLVSERGYVNQMKIRTPNAGAKSFDVWLETGDPIVDGYVQTGGIQIGAGTFFASSYP